MRLSLYLWIAPAGLLCLVGVAVLWLSTHSTSDLADAGVLTGATLTAFTLFPASVAIDHRIRANKLRKHLTHRHRPHTRMTHVTSPESTPPDTL